MSPVLPLRTVGPLFYRMAGGQWSRVPGKKRGAQTRRLSELEQANLYCVRGAMHAVIPAPTIQWQASRSVRPTCPRTPSPSSLQKTAEAISPAWENPELESTRCRKAVSPPTSAILVPLQKEERRSSAMRQGCGLITDFKAQTSPPPQEKLRPEKKKLA